jgi:hypothetical protein
MFSLFAVLQVIEPPQHFRYTHLCWSGNAILQSVACAVPSHVVLQHCVTNAFAECVTLCTPVHIT